MKRAALITFLIMTFNPSFSQTSTIDDTEISKMILSTEQLSKFIINKFKHFKATKSELLKENHPLVSQRFNMILNDTTTNYTLTGLPVRTLYAYLKNDKRIALYVLMDVDYQQTKNLIDLFGMPWNITLEDYEIGDFEMLLWDKNLFEVSMLHDFVTGGLQTNCRVITINNIPIKELINDDPWE